MRWLFAFLIAFSTLPSLQADDAEDLLHDLMIVDYWNQKIKERYPIFYNHWLLGGYINMPSSRMGLEGEIGVGYSYVPPYRSYNLRGQLASHLETSFNYRIFHGIKDPILSSYGFGNLSDKGVSLKLAIFHPEDSNYELPGLSIGFEDFMGTKNFIARYIVMTQVIPSIDVEATLGYGTGRIDGFFGGLSWMPFRQTYLPILSPLNFIVEYDATPYFNPEIEKHPHGRNSRSKFNGGIKYRFGTLLDFSASYIRGCEWAFSASTYYNFGFTEGFLPKIDDPLPYRSPMNTEPIGWRRPEEIMVQELGYAMKAQGLELLEVRYGYNTLTGRTLYLTVENDTYYLEKEVRNRLNHLLAFVIPNNIDCVYVTIETERFPIQEYRYTMEYVREFACQIMGPHELRILTPMREISCKDPCSSRLLFKKQRDWWNIEIMPKTSTFFGSASGKFKYGLGVNLALNGFIWGDIFYSMKGGYFFLSDLSDIGCVDRLNPSQLPIVRSDIIQYLKQTHLTLDEFYLQKNWNLGCGGLYSKISGGYFEIEYAGLATEWLYYPVKADWAIGVEGAIFKKRKFSPFGLTNTVRQYHGFCPTYRNFFFSQYFADLYYDWKALNIDFKMMAGKFLANDTGARFEITRYFPSGLRITIWYTRTNGNDKINGSRYYDKGVEFSLPLDIFYTYSERSRWGYGMSAWLRDVGVIADTGKGLYNLIREQRIE